MGMIGKKRQAEAKPSLGQKLMQVAKTTAFVSDILEDEKKPVGPGTDSGLFGMFKKKQKMVK